MSPNTTNAWFQGWSLDTIYLTLHCGDVYWHVLLQLSNITSSGKNIPCLARGSVISPPCARHAHHLYGTRPYKQYHATQATHCRKWYSHWYLEHKSLQITFNTTKCSFVINSAMASCCTCWYTHEFVKVIHVHIATTPSLFAFMKHWGSWVISARSIRVVSLLESQSTSLHLHPNVYHPWKLSFCWRSKNYLVLFKRCTQRCVQRCACGHLTPKHKFDE